MAQQTVVTSKQFNLTLNDWWKGLIIAVISTPLTIIATSIEAGEFEFDWKKILSVMAISLIGYILRNLFRPSAIVLKNPTEAQVEAVKEGDAKVTVTQK